MFGFWGFFKRNLETARPKKVPKLDGALRIGLFGASNIGYVRPVSEKSIYWTN